MTAATSLRAVLDAQMTEKDFQQAVVSLAQMMGWKTYHTFRADRSPAGFPDLVLIKNGRLVFWECKRETGKPTPEQRAWIDALSLVPGVEARFIFPSSWAYVEAVLTA